MRAIRVVLKGGQVFDGVSDVLTRADVVMDGGTIAEVGLDVTTRADDQVVDVEGLTVMPGLIDAHVHAYTATADAAANDRLHLTYAAQWARHVAEGWLNRGFTTVRDVAGGDLGLANAIDSGLVNGPRLLYSGKALTQTAGAADMRPTDVHDWCRCAPTTGHISRVVDGPDEILRAVREVLGGGADFIKIFGSGAIASKGRVHKAEFSDDEIRTVVDEVERQGTYVTAHCHDDHAIRRCIELGVHCIEHASLISDETLALAAERGVTLVPTLAIARSMADNGHAIGMPAPFLEKLAGIEPLMWDAFARMIKSGAVVGFGSDTLGEFDKYQTTEFQLRGQLCSPVEVLRQATSINAAVVRRPDLGRVAKGCTADVIALAGNPLANLELFSADGAAVRLVVVDGRVRKNTL